MDEKRMPGGIRPETEGGEGYAFTAEAPEHGGAARAVIPVVGIGASAGGLEVFKRLLGDFPGDTGFAIVFVNISIQIITACWPGFLREPPPCRSARRPMACR